VVLAASVRLGVQVVVAVVQVLQAVPVVAVAMVS